ncbi:MAG TPA: hypothetical protein VHU40_04070 [Polyangia bacterium]|jgi:hypothetical protein|nr:hypothetical protein [Polyangia bacterium]
MRFSLVGVAAVVALALCEPGGAHARAARSSEKAKPSTARKDKGKAGKNGKAAVDAKADAKSGADAPALPPPKGKVAVFAFTGDGAAPIYKEILHILQAKGLKVQTSIRPMDTAEQYRELAQTLDLIAFVDGEIEVDGAQASATVHVRNGVSGLRVVSTTFAGEKKKLPGDLARGLWDQVSNALSQATADAAGPRRHDRAPLRIEAGTPLNNTPPEETDNRASTPAKVAAP